ncbi:MAG: T9SS type A sorting domain-containing protein [Bacteroidetes bacterium]|nr:T9SS type A sorting domain-containing protein [Bacteroidota bacterium]
MRLLFTLLIAALSLNAFSQGIPQLPYNPDENGDGLIGVPDLQGLLSQYGLEFNSAVVSDDAESAIVYMGEMAHPVCNLACDNLPGVWHMSTMNDLGLVWDEVTTSNDSIWVGSSPHDVNPTSPFAYYDLWVGQTIDISDFSAGVYLVRVNSPTKQSTKKLVVR